MGRSAGRTDGRTDAPAHADAQSSARSPSHTHTHTHSRRHRDTRRYTHTRARTSSRQPARLPARRRPESALPGKCGVSVGAFVWGAGRRRARGPSRDGLAAETSSSPRGCEAGARPRHAPMGLPAPPDWGRGPHPGKEAWRWGAGKKQQPLLTELGRGSGVGSGWWSWVRASAGEAGARLLAASPLQVCSSRERLEIAASLLACKLRLPRFAAPGPCSLNHRLPTHHQNKSPVRCLLPT